MQENILQIIDDLNTGDYPEQKINKVITDLNKFTEEEDLDALFSLGDALVASGLNDYAEKIYRYLYEYTSHDDEVLAYLCDLLIADDRLDEALSLVNQAEKTPAVLMVKAEIFQQLNMADVAIRSLFDAKELADEPVIDFALAELYFHEGSLDEANRHYQLLLSDGFDVINQVDINLRLAEINLNLLNLDEAIENFESAAKENYTNDDFYREGLAYYQRGEYTRAENLLKKVISNEPYFINGYILLMNVYETEHNLTEALKILEEYLVQDQTNSLIYFHSGRLNFKMENNDQAVQHLLKATTLDDDFDDAYLMLFETLLKMDDTEYIREILPDLDIHSLSGESLYLLAKIEQENENDENAGRFYEEAEALIGESVEFYQDYYYYLTEIRAPKRMDILDKLIALEPDNTEWKLEKERVLADEDEL